MVVIETRTDIAADHQGDQKSTNTKYPTFLTQELLALEEDIGKVEIGLTTDEIKALPYVMKSHNLPPSKYKS